MDAAMLSRMMGNYCSDYHDIPDKTILRLRGIIGSLALDSGTLCQECSRLLMHVLVKLVNCPFEPKPSCKRCVQPCYAGEYRIFVKTVMRHSGMRLIKSGRLDLIILYFLRDSIL